MCVGNRAANSAFYINKQLEALWSISRECVKKHGEGVKAENVDVEYGTALGQFCMGKNRTINPSVNDLTFFTYFGSAPHIKFICNHELVITFNIKHGHYRLEGKFENEKFESYKCAFRVPFHEHTIVDKSFVSFGSTSPQCKTKLLILDFNSAKFLRDFSGFPAGHKIPADIVDLHHKYVEKYLSGYYLPLLQKAGVHCLHSLPDFDNLSRTHKIDYSALNEIEIEETHLFNISIETVNAYLRGRWLEATALIDRLGEHDYHNHSITSKYILAEHRGVHDELHFRAFFGPPRIHVRCSKEVIYTVDVEEIDFYMEGGFESKRVHKIKNSKIAFLIDARLIEEEGGFVKRIHLDLSKARYCESGSHFVSEVIDKTILIRLRSAFVEYITERYISILKEHHHHEVYHKDVRIIEEHEEDGFYSGGGSIESIFLDNEFKEHVTITETHGFDLVTAVSQGSLNDHFRSIWEASRSVNGCLSSWAYQDQFDASFGPLQVQFPVDVHSHTIILYVNILEGFLTNMGLDKKIIAGDIHEFSRWRLAFEVKVLLKTSSHPHPVFDHRFKDKEEKSDWIFKQLVLDLSHVVVRYDLSHLPDILGHGDSWTIRAKCGALLHYVAHQYFQDLQKENHHVLYSVPILKKAQTDRHHHHHYAPTSIQFQFYPASSGAENKLISALFGTHRDEGNKNMLIICGMFNGREGPALPLPHGSSWTSTHGEKRFSGTFALSRSTLLEGWLLQELERINERTTIIPVFHGIEEDGRMDLTLVRWSEHPSVKLSKKRRACSWKKVGTTSYGVEYAWNYKDEWTYTHEDGANPAHNGGYSVSCHTSNTLLLPTHNHNGVCDIQLRGKVDLKLTFVGSEKHWQTESSATWSGSIQLYDGSEGHGLQIKHSSKIDLVKPAAQIGRGLAHEGHLNASTLLREHLRDVTLIEEKTIQTLQSSFTSVWPLFSSGAYGYSLGGATFNSQGDLLFQLVSPLGIKGHVDAVGAEHYCIRFARPLAVKSRYHQEVTQGRLSLLRRISKNIQDFVSTNEENGHPNGSVVSSKSNGSHHANGAAKVSTTVVENTASVISTQEKVTTKEQKITVVKSAGVVLS